MVDRVSKSRAASLMAARALRWLAVLLTSLTLGYALVPRAAVADVRPAARLRRHRDRACSRPGRRCSALLCLIMLFQRHRCKGALLGGFGAPVVASLGLGLGAAFSAGVSYRVADYLDGGAVPSPADFGAGAACCGLEPPVSYQWAAFGFVLLVVVVSSRSLWIRLVTKPLLRRRARPDTDDDYPGGRAARPGPGRGHRRGRSPTPGSPTTSSRTVRRRLDRAGRGRPRGDRPRAVRHRPGAAGAVRSGRPRTSLSIVANAGTYLISLSVLGLVLLGVQTYRNARVRRTVGVIWDLGTFWPRAAHPLAPPCYAERVVPELVHRATWLANEQGGLVLSGHSQGSVLAAAAVLQLPPEARERTALLTYGSPLCRLYMRAFPNYFSEKVINDIGAAVAGPGGQDGGSTCGGGPTRSAAPSGSATGASPTRSRSTRRPATGCRPRSQAHCGYQVTPQFEPGHGRPRRPPAAAEAPPARVPDGPSSRDPLGGDRPCGIIFTAKVPVLDRGRTGPVAVRRGGRGGGRSATAGTAAIGRPAAAQRPHQQPDRQPIAMARAAASRPRSARSSPRRGTPSQPASGRPRTRCPARRRPAGAAGPRRFSVIVESATRSAEPVLALLQRGQLGLAPGQLGLDRDHPPGGRAGLAGAAQGTPGRPGHALHDHREPARARGAG